MTTSNLFLVTLKEFTPFRISYVFPRFYKTISAVILHNLKLELLSKYNGLLKALHLHDIRLQTLYVIQGSDH